jgi:hypothetical protein
VIVAALAPEVGAALIAGALTFCAAVWQTTRTLRDQAKISAEATRDQAKLAAGTALLPLRGEAYRELWSLLDVGPEEAPERLASERDRGGLADRLTAWYYPHGLLLSDGSQKQWRACRDALREPGSLDAGGQRRLHGEVSLLRSWLKADMLLRTIDEVSVAARDIRAEESEDQATG